MIFPTIGSVLTLIEPWKFTVYMESRNIDFLKNISEKNLCYFYEHRYMEYFIGQNADNATPVYHGDPVANITLSIGTPLIVDRIYLRNGKSEFDSITFRITKDKNRKDRVHGRFWAKLSDVNRMKATVELPPPCFKEPETKPEYTIFLP